MSAVSGALGAGALSGGATAWVLIAIAVLAAPAAVRVGAAPSMRRGGGGGERSLPLTLDLAAAALRSGQPLPQALLLAAPAAGDAARTALVQVAGLLRLGAGPEEAWSATPRDGLLGEVAAVAVRSADSGIRLAKSFERLAADLRDEAAASAAARAHRAGVHAMGPLAACFLPSFVCLGVVPVIVGIARDVAATLV